MQGTQSSSIPEHSPGQSPDQTFMQSPDQPGRMSSLSGPLEAARRGLERQRASETGLEVVHGEASDGRPAWLRRWPSEVRREIATERWAASGSVAAKLADQRQAGVQESDREAAGATAGSATHPAIGSTIDGTYTNGYTGQSIEAAFTFDTVYRFETEFEAEATEDWLNLSSDRASLEGLDRGSERTAKPDLEARTEPRTDVPAEGKLAPDAFLPVSASGIDPQAVRAAIFRLAQESAAGRGGERPSTTIGATPELDSTGPDGPGFAEVAWRVWQDSEESGHAAAQPPNTVLPELLAHSTRASAGTASSQDTESAAACLPENHAVSGGTSDAAEYRDASHGQDAVPERMSPEEISAEQQNPEQQNPEQQNPEQQNPEQQSPGQEVLKASACGPEKTGLLPGEGSEANLAEVSLERGAASEAGLQPVQDGQRDTTGSTPALANDAGDLLSAQDLYGELVALSGVLRTRHTHYAEDLKLLAARSEVLIDRLLAIYRASENKAQMGVQENVSSPAASGSPAGAIGATGQDVSTGRVAAATVDRAIENVVDQTFVPQTAQAAKGTSGIGAVHDEPLLFEASDAGLKEPGNASTFVDKGSREVGEVAPLNLVDLLTRWRSLLSTIGHGSVEVNFGPSAALPIRVTEEAMERILVHVVHNARTATQRGGAIRIGVGRTDKRRPTEPMPSSGGRAQPGSRMVLTVDDSGCGMTEDQIAKILEGRPTLAAASDEAAGQPRQGRGLQIVRALIAASGGRLAIYSRCGAGTRIEMEWPAVEDDVSWTRLPPASVGAMGEVQQTRPTRWPSQIQRREAGDDAAYPLRQGTDTIANGVEGAIAC